MAVQSRVILSAVAQACPAHVQVQYGMLLQT